jgi:hypothetical protein
MSELNIPKTEKVDEIVEVTTPSKDEVTSQSLNIANQAIRGSQSRRTEIAILNKYKVIDLMSEEDKLRYLQARGFSETCFNSINPIFLKVKEENPEADRFELIKEMKPIEAEFKKTHKFVTGSQ